MFFNQRRIRSLDHHLDAATAGKKLRVAVGLSKHKRRLMQLGFSDPLVVGESILPSAQFGPSCRFNAEGKEIPQKHLPKETLYRSQMWTHIEHHGTEEREVETLVSIPYQRYPRKIVPPPAVKITIQASKEGELFGATDFFVRGQEDAQLLSGINVFLEIFGECELQYDDGRLLRPPKIQSLDWDILPTGSYPWERVRESLRNSFKGTRPHTLAAIEWRMEKLYGFDPDSINVGRSGFSGYVIFCYPKLDLYVLECRRPDNATYVLGADWKTLSKLTKAEILNASLHKTRIIHNDSWLAKVSRLFVGR